MKVMFLTPAQIQRGRTDWLQRWDKEQRRFLSVDVESIVFQMFERHGYALMGKRKYSR